MSLTVNRIVKNEVSDDIMNNRLILDLESFSKGTYLIKGITKDGVNTAKLMVY